jgi:hypothetical protein
MRIHGWEVTIDYEGVRIPCQCANCGGPKELFVATGAGRGTGWFSRSVVRLTLHMPYCRACAERMHATGLRVVALSTLVTLLGIVLPGAGLVLLKLRYDALPASFAAAAVAIVGATVAAFVLGQKRPVAPATSTLDAVSIESFENVAPPAVCTARLFCTNQAWAERLANVTTARPATVTRARGPIAVAWCAVLAAAMVALVWQQGTAYARSQGQPADRTTARATPTTAAAPASARAPGGSAPSPAPVSPAVRGPSRAPSTPKRR